MRTTRRLQLYADIRECGLSKELVDALLNINCTTIGELMKTPIMTLLRNGIIKEHYIELCAFFERVRLVHYQGVNAPY